MFRRRPGTQAGAGITDVADYAISTAVTGTGSAGTSTRTRSTDACRSTPAAQSTEQAKIAIGYDGAIVIEVVALVAGRVTTLVVVPVYHHHFLVLGINGDPVAGSLDLHVAGLRRGRGIVYGYIVNERVIGKGRLEMLGQSLEIVIREHKLLELGVGHYPAAAVG